MPLVLGETRRKEAQDRMMPFPKEIKKKEKKRNLLYSISPRARIQMRARDGSQRLLQLCSSWSMYHHSLEAQAKSEEALLRRTSAEYLVPNCRLPRRSAHSPIPLWTHIH